MRCACPACGVFMIHTEHFSMGCVCPACALHCAACLGTDTLLSKEELKKLESAFYGGSGEPKKESEQ